MRSIQHDSFPLNLVQGEALCEGRTHELSQRQRIYVWIEYVLSSIRRQTALYPKTTTNDYNPSPHQMVWSQLEDLWIEIHCTCTEHERKKYLNFALEKGLLSIMLSFIEVIYKPCSIFALRTQTWMRQRAMLFLNDLADLIHKFARSEYQVDFFLRIRNILWSPHSLKLSLDIFTVQEKFSTQIQRRFWEAVDFNGTIPEQSKTFYYLFRKFKEIIFTYLVNNDIEHHQERFDRIIKMTSVVENVVHEAYCTAICMENLIHQQISTKRLHLLHLASLKLQELLWIINELLYACRDLFQCDDSVLIIDSTERMVFAGMPRLIHVLVTILISFQEDNLYVNDQFVVILADILRSITLQPIAGLNLWFTLYSVADIDRILHTCSEENDSIADTHHYKDELLFTRRILSKMSPPKYIIDPIFQSVSFELNREIPPREPILTIRKLNRISPSIKLHVSLKICLELIEKKIDGHWYEKKYWSDATEEILASC